MDIKEILSKHFSDLLTEDVSTEVETMFEALVESKVAEKVEALVKSKEKELEESCASELAEWKSELVEKLNDYVGLTVDDFLVENEAVVTENIKAHTADKIMSGMMDLFKECHIEIPETEINVVADLKESVDSLTSELNDVTNSKIESDKQIVEYAMAIEFLKLTEGLADTESEKVMSLVENMTFDGVEDIATKVGIIIENVKNDKSDDTDDTILNESFDSQEDEESVVSEISKYIPIS